MLEAGIIPQEYYMDVFKMTNLKNKLISTWEVSPEELYRSLEELTPKFGIIVKEISKSLKKLLEERSVKK